MSLLAPQRTLFLEQQALTVGSRTHIKGNMEIEDILKKAQEGGVDLKNLTFKAKLIGSQFHSLKSKYGRGVVTAKYSWEDFLTGKVLCEECKNSIHATGGWATVGASLEKLQTAFDYAGVAQRLLDDKPLSAYEAHSIKRVLTGTIYTPWNMPLAVRRYCGKLLEPAAQLIEQGLTKEHIDALWEPEATEDGIWLTVLRRLEGQIVQEGVEDFAAQTCNDLRAKSAFRDLKNIPGANILQLSLMKAYPQRGAVLLLPSYVADILIKVYGGRKRLIEPEHAEEAMDIAYTLLRDKRPMSYLREVPEEVLEKAAALAV